MQEAPHDDVRGRGAVQEEEIMVVQSGSLKTPAVVQLPVQTHHGRDLVLAEVRNVGFGGVEGVACRRMSKLVTSSVGTVKLRKQQIF